MYKEYLCCEYGIIEVLCDEQFLLHVIVVKEKSESIPNKITNLVISQLKLYFDGLLYEFNLPIKYDNSFNSKVLYQLSLVKYGELKTYKDLAIALDSKAYQAVGNAMASNPYCIVLPCHRIIKSDGSLGNYFYGTKMKRSLIDFEQRLILESKLCSDEVFDKMLVDKLVQHPYLSKVFDKIEVANSYQVYNDYFVALVSQIIYQQVAFKTAQKVESRLYYYLNYEITPESLLALSDLVYKEFGINRSRVSYIRNICHFIIDNRDWWDNIVKASNEEIYEILGSIKGVGVWTIEMFLLFGLKRRNVLSFRDLIIVNSLKKLYDVDVISPDLESRIRDSLVGIESIASINLWKYAIES